jgi:MFS family permease
MQRGTPAVLTSDEGLVTIPLAAREARTSKVDPAVPDHRLVALIIACALFMEHLDATILATALPSMARSFGVAAPSMGAALTAYLLALAIFIPASGAIADRLGAKPVFRTAIGLFVVSSLACGFANGLTALVLARFVQGMGGAMMMPVGRLVLLRSVARRDMVSAMS